MPYMKNARRKKDLGITGLMAKWYDRNSRKSRKNEMRGYAAEVAGLIPPGAAVLEVAPGPGLLSIALAEMGDYQVTGMDISADFVRIASANARQAGADVRFIQGNVSSMPFAAGQFDFIICSAAFKNFRAPRQALNEMCRVLKPGGTALIIDMNHNASRAAQEAELARMNAKGFDKFFVRLAFRTFLRQGAYTREEFAGLLRQSEFRDYEIKEIGMSLYVYCRKPEVRKP